MTKRAGKVAFSGRLAQLVRAAGLQPAGRGFESLSAHWSAAGERAPGRNGTEAPRTGPSEGGQAPGAKTPAPPGNGGAPRRGAGVEAQSETHDPCPSPALRG
jgi:hypothetical protein